MLEDVTAGHSSGIPKIQSVPLCWSSRPGRPELERQRDSEHKSNSQKRRPDCDCNGERCDDK